MDYVNLAKINNIILEKMIRTLRYITQIDMYIIIRLFLSQHLRTYEVIKHDSTPCII